MACARVVSRVRCGVDPTVVFEVSRPSRRILPFLIVILGPRYLGPPLAIDRRHENTRTSSVRGLGCRVTAVAACSMVHGHVRDRTRERLPTGSAAHEALSESE